MHINPNQFENFAELEATHPDFWAVWKKEPIFQIKQGLTTDLYEYNDKHPLIYLRLVEILQTGVLHKEWVDAFSHKIVKTRKVGKLTQIKINELWQALLDFETLNICHNVTRQNFGAITFSKETPNEIRVFFSPKFANDTFETILLGVNYLSGYPIKIGLDVGYATLTIV